MNPVHKLSLAELGIGERLTKISAENLLIRLRSLSIETEVKTLLILGDPDVFCGGGAESLVQEIVGSDPHLYVDFVRELYRFPLPVVMAMEGGAYGAGLGFAMALGDYFVAANEARYGFHFIRMGITPGMGISFLLPEKVGLTFASQMMYSGKLFRGKELRQHPQGSALFHQITPKDQVVTEAENWAFQLAQAPRQTLIELKKLMRPNLPALMEAVGRETTAFKQLGSDPETMLSIHQYFQQINQPNKTI